MAYTAEPRYTERVDAMVEPELAEYIQHRAETEKVSKSSIVRRLLEIGRITEQDLAAELDAE